MKRLLSILMLAMLCLTAAQAKFVYWKYYGSDYEGYGTATQGKGAIYIPADVAQCYVGKTVTGVRVGLNTSADELRVFLTRSLDGEPLLTKDADRANVGNNMVKFDEPYTITGEGFYVGYEFKGEYAAMGISKCYNPNGNWTDLGSGWTNNAADASNPANALAIAARIEGDELPFEVALAGVNNVTTHAGDPFQITGSVLNISDEKILKYRIGYTVGDEEEQYADFEQTIGARSDGEFSISHDGIYSATSVPLKVRLVSAGDRDDVYAANNTANASILFAYVGAQKRAVMEEFTGIYCGYCPRGIVGIQKCQERFGDRFIAIAKHCYSGTPSGLLSPTYDYNIGGGFPKCIIDRRYQCDPGPSKSPGYVSASLSQGCSAGVAVEAYFDEGGDSTQIQARVTAQFTSAHTGGGYRFALAIVEDGVTGYQQANNFSGSSTEMGGFENLPSHASIDFDHVARMGLGVKDGIENSIPKNVDEFHPVVYTATLDVPANVQRKKNLRVVALLINTSTGYIDNAAETGYVKVGSLTGISDVAAVAPAPDVEIHDGQVVAEGFGGSVEVYTIGGVRVPNSGLPHGIYIVRLVGGGHTYVKRIAY